MKLSVAKMKCFVCAVVIFSGGSQWAGAVEAPPAVPSPSVTAKLPERGLTREERIGWWREGRFGMFIHWGLYAIPGGVWKDTVRATGYSEWVM